MKDKEIDIELKPTYKEVRLLVNSIKSKYPVIELEKALDKQGPFQGLEGICPLMGQWLDDFRTLNWKEINSEIPFL